ncbi:MAG: winged helix DNA-binding domain-containing protein [Dermatophilaceae bacterium]
MVTTARASGARLAVADRRRVRRLRLAGQLLWPGQPRTPLEVVRHLGAAQAQDLGSGMWSVGIRAGVSAAQVEAAMARRQIVRTWPMRGTLHFVPAQDARWMCQLLAGPAVRSARARFAGLGLTDEVLSHARRTVEAALADGPRTRRALFAVLRDAGFDPDGQRGIHVLGRLCQQGALCQAAPDGRQPTFALLDQWVPRSLAPSREEGLATVVGRYLHSHGPVTEADVAGWLGAPLRVAREALALLGDVVVREVIGDTAYLAHRLGAEAAPAGSVHLLPMWDEYLLGYKDRTAALRPADAGRVTPGTNGVFQPTVLVDGQVAGVWRRHSGGATTTLAVEVFEPLPPAAARRLRSAVTAYGSYLGMPVRWAGEAGPR